MTKFISIEEVNQKAKELAFVLKNKHPFGGFSKLYGVPRGGIPAAYSVASQDSEIFTVVHTPEEADVIIDDLIDSGKTKEYYNQFYPDKPFFTLFDKPEEWLVFPWEFSNEDTSADDIPLRLLQYVGEDTSRGGLQETPKRFLKAWKHWTSGYGKDPATVMKVFEDGAESYNEMVLVKNIPVYSKCEHHLADIIGVAHVAYIPNGKIVGLSKLSRVVDIFARRLQVQERLTNQVAEALVKNLDPLGVAVVLECRHMCMESRGICQQGHTTVTSSMHGVFFNDASTRAEFMGLIK